MRGNRTTAMFVAVLLALATLGLTAAGAGATPPDHARAVVADTAADPAAVAAYWTTERMAAAVPAEVVLEEHDGPRGRSVERGRSRIVAPMHHRPGHAGGPGGGGGDDGGGGNGTVTVTGAPWLNDEALVAHTTGKLFFTLDGTNYVCSGSVVNSSHDSLVLTAGHCVHRGSGGTSQGFATNVAFVPAYAGSGTNQVGPYGVWAGTQLSTTSQWANSGSFDHDVGFIRTETKSGQTITQAVGGSQGIGFNQPRNVHVYAFGYPHAAPYDGTTLTYCAGNAQNDRFGGSSAQGVTCDMTGGSSGGPWYAGFDEAEGTGTSYSVNSFKYRIGPQQKLMFGPYFGSVIETLYNTVNTVD